MTLHTFGPDDGVQPLSPLLQTAGDDFFGTTSLGPNGGARVFHMNASGTVTLSFLVTEAKFFIASMTAF